MRALILILSIVTCVQFGYSQGDKVIVTPTFLSKMQEVEVPQFDDSRESEYIIYFPMKYAKFLFTDEDRETFLTLSDTIIERIDLVYTVFRREKSFDQEKLNRERYDMLQENFPQAFNNNLIDWNLIAQDGAVDYEEARTYFHGFVIYIKPHRMTDKDGFIVETVMDRRIDEPETRILETNEEIENVKKLLTQASTPTKIIKDTVITKVKKKKFTGYYLHKNKKKRKKGKKFDKHKKGRIREYTSVFKEKVTITEKVVPDPDGKPLETAEKILQQVTDDTVVYATMSRLMERWEDNVIVQDVTGSMYPYLTQTLLYLKNHIRENATEKFVFFNDGNSKPDGPIGRAGGCYYVSANNSKEIEDMAYEAMSKGKGGKPSENDVEAILYGIKKFPRAQGIVLIADNFSRVRDIVLIRELVKIGKPVRVIVCGIAKGDVVNLDYIYLAQLTGGSIHTIDKDFDDLASKKDGDVFKVGAQLFQMEGKRIKLLGHNKKSYKRF
ncbi:MAG: hypothetical protein GY810_31410 [Aureispira sp.]|nr:hypothetical protein [Aureispira sp.]